MTAAPDLHTERLILRGHCLADFGDVTALWADPIVTRYIGGRPISAEEAWSKLLRNVGHWPLVGFGYWVVREKSSGRFVGEVGFLDAKRELSPSFGTAPEAGWALMPWAHGRGFAREAVLSASAWLEGRFGRVRTVCMIDPGNEPSLRLAGKLGYREFARTEYKNSPTILFERQG